MNISGAIAKLYSAQSLRDVIMNEEGPAIDVNVRISTETVAAVRKFVDEKGITVRAVFEAAIREFRRMSEGEKEKAIAAYGNQLRSASAEVRHVTVRLEPALKGYVDERHKKYRTKKMILYGAAVSSFEERHRAKSEKRGANAKGKSGAAKKATPKRKTVKRKT